VPALGLPAFYDSLLYLILHWIVLATSWNILSGYTRLLLLRPRRLLRRRHLHQRHADVALGLALPVDAAGGRGGGLRAGVVVGAIVFRVKGIRGEVFALLTLAVTFVLGTIIVNTPIDGGNGVCVARGRPSPSSGRRRRPPSTCWR